LRLEIKQNTLTKRIINIWLIVSSGIKKIFDIAIESLTSNKYVCLCNKNM